MSLTDRDRKILRALIPLALVVAYWFLVLAPKRDEASTLQDSLTQAQSARDTAVQRATSLSAAKRSFATDYATVIALGKSIPTSVDMPSLIVQLDSAARGTGIDFKSIQVGDRTGGTTSSTTPSGTPGGSGPAASSTPAQSGPGQTAQGAGKSVTTANNASSASAGAGSSSSSTSTSTSTSTSGSSASSTPSAGASSAASTGAAAGAQVAGLDSVPLDFEFDGSYFQLADFFHRMKRFVRVANDKIMVSGRLMTINSLSFDAKDTFPQLKATLHATVYLAPKTQGVSAGASASGPAGTPPAAGAGQTASNPPTPTATVTTR